jgi:hypothetical protein
MSSEARFHPAVTGYLYSRYKRFGDDTMDESFFPIIWRDDGYRSPFIPPYLDKSVGWAGNPMGDRRLSGGQMEMEG